MNLQHIKSEAVLAEFVGTFGLTFAVLAALSTPILGLPTGVVAAITVGLFVLLLGPVSGAHINPAITIGHLSLGNTRYSTALSYIIAQLSGALLALVVFGLFNNNNIYSLGGVETWKVFWAEALGASVLGVAIAASVYNNLKPVASSLAIGGGILIGGIFASVASNGVINPAVAVGIGSASWPYIAGPALGVIIGMQLYKMLLPPVKIVKKAKSK